jgi:nucleoside-diphosphate kinase
MLRVQLNPNVNNQKYKRTYSISFGAIERTLIGLKPDAYERKLSKPILNQMLAKTDLKIIAKKIKQWPVDVMEKHYSEHREKKFFAELISYVTRGNFGAYVLEGDNAIEKARNASFDIRKLFSTSKTENLIHSSDSAEAAKREINNFFPELK